MNQKTLFCYVLFWGSLCYHIQLSVSSSCEKLPGGWYTKNTLYILPRGPKQHYTVHQCFSPKSLQPFLHQGSYTSCFEFLRTDWNFSVHDLILLSQSCCVKKWRNTHVLYTCVCFCAKLLYVSMRVSLSCYLPWWRLIPKVLSFFL